MPPLMGLDWCVNAKLDTEGNEIHPLETVNCPRLLRTEPETVEHFLKIVESHRRKITEDTRTEYADYWNQPNDVLIDESLGEFLPDMMTEKPWTKDDEIRGSFLCGATSFRGKALNFCEQLSSHVRDAAYEDMSPRRAVEYAMEIEDDINEMPVSDPEQKRIAEEAAHFLKFWGGNGHGIYAWF